MKKRVGVPNIRKTKRTKTGHWRVKDQKMAKKKHNDKRSKTQSRSLEKFLTKWPTSLEA